MEAIDAMRKFGFALVRRLHERTFKCQEITDILNQIKPHVVTAEHCLEYTTLDINTELMNSDPSYELISHYTT